ncbi:MAG: hypothetical protein HY719_03815 [Planctomycetes bacterium]|nr:hypothetical protein [Planctomycetota bacterium]
MLDVTSLASTLIAVSLPVVGVYLFLLFLIGQYDRDIGNLQRVALTIRQEMIRKQKEAAVARYRDPLFRPIIATAPLLGDDEDPPRTENERRIVRMLAEGRLVVLETNTRHLQPGMVVGRTVKDRNGAELVRRGAELTSAMVAKLAELEVDAVWILYDPTKIRRAANDELKTPST